MFSHSDNRKFKPLMEEIYEGNKKDEFEALVKSSDEESEQSDKEIP